MLAVILMCDPSDVEGWFLTRTVKMDVDIICKTATCHVLKVPNDENEEYRHFPSGQNVRLGYHWAQLY